MGLLGPSLGVRRHAQRPPEGGSEQYTRSTLNPGDCGGVGGLPTRTPVSAGHACRAVGGYSGRKGHTASAAYHSEG